MLEDTLLQFKYLCIVLNKKMMYAMYVFNSEVRRVVMVERRFCGPASPGPKVWNADMKVNSCNESYPSINII